MSAISFTPEKEKLAPATQSARQKPRKSRYIPLYLSVAPFYVLFTIFGLFPVLFSLYLAFQKWDGLSPMHFIGLNNFSYLLSDSAFYQSIGNTIFIWLLSTIPTLFLALSSAFLLNTAIRHKTLYKIAFFLPHVTSVVAIAIIFSSIFSNQSGLLNALIISLGGKKVSWLLDPLGIKMAIASMIIWRATGYNAIIYLAGLQSIPKVLYEAARIDGAHSWQIFRSITIPLMRPIILFTIITSTISGLQVFTEPQVLVGPNGGAGASGMTMVLYLYQQAFSRDRFGYGSAVGWGMFVIIVAFSALNWKIVQRAGTH